jgi:hypothetical protein
MHSNEGTLDQETKWIRRSPTWMLREIPSFMHKILKSWGVLKNVIPFFLELVDVANADPICLETNSVHDAFTMLHSDCFLHTSCRGTSPWRPASASSSARLCSRLPASPRANVRSINLDVPQRLRLVTSGGPKGSRWK